MQFTLKDFQAFCAAQPASDAVRVWSEDCAIGQFARAVFPGVEVSPGFWHISITVNGKPEYHALDRGHITSAELSEGFGDPRNNAIFDAIEDGDHTWGAVAQRLREVMDKFDVVAA